MRWTREGYFWLQTFAGPLQNHCWSKKSVTGLGIKLSSACFLFQVCATFKFIPRDITSSIRLKEQCHEDFAVLRSILC